LRAAFDADWPRVKVAMFAGDPAQQPRGSWQGYPAIDMLKTPHAHLNTYFSVGVQTGSSRGLAGFESVRVIVLDDVGTKTSLGTAGTILGTAPSYIIETSPGNCQAGWFTEIASRDWARALMVSLYEALGRKGDNIKNLVGYMRLPVGTNGKAHLGPRGWSVRLLRWAPSVRIKALDWIAIEQRLGGITPVSGRALSVVPATMPDPGDIEADAVLAGFRMLGRVQGARGRDMTMGWGYDVECPWADEHSDRVHEGASYVPVRGRFHCHHGHCQDRTMGDVRERLSALLKADHGTTLAALEFDDVDPLTFQSAVARLPDQDRLLATSEKTEYGMALAFAAKHRGTLKFDHARGCWFRWTGGYWQQDMVKCASRWALELLQRYRDTAQDASAGWLRSTGKIAFANGIESAARSLPEMAVDGRSWDQDVWLAGAPGCEIDLRTGQVLAPDPDHEITKQLLVGPRIMPVPVWDQFLWDSTGGDLALIGFLQAWCGYCLTGDTREERFVFIYGPGGNGKSTFLHVLNAILNDYGCHVPAEMFMVRKHEAHPEGIARLAGVRAITASEIAQGETFNVVRLKTFTGGDKLTGRFMRQNTFEFLPQFKPIFAGNDQPRLPEVDDAMRRRLILVPFTQKPTTVDIALKDKLVPEYPGILAWMIEGENRRRTMGGLAALIPSAAAQATTRYLDGQDQLKAWADERCVFGPGQQVGVTQALDDYRSWCFDQGEMAKLGTRNFGVKFTEKFPTCVKDHKMTGAVLVGVSLKPQAV
jgi:putative DNA primase/helicase